MPTTSSAMTATFKSADSIGLRCCAVRRVMPYTLICAKSPFAVLLPGLMGLYPILYADSTRTKLSLYVSCGRPGDIWRICYLMPAVNSLCLQYFSHILLSPPFSAVNSFFADSGAYDCVAGKIVHILKVNVCGSQVIATSSKRCLSSSRVT